VRKGVRMRARSTILDLHFGLHAYARERAQHHDSPPLNAAGGLREREGVLEKDCARESAQHHAWLCIAFCMCMRAKKRAKKQMIDLH